MMKNIIYSLAVLVFLFISCKEGSQTGKELKLQYSDESYTLIEKGDGVKGNAGDFSVFSISITGDNGKVLLDRTKEKDYGKYEIPSDTSKFLQGSPVDELLSILTVGDSATLVYELDSMEKLNPAVMGINELTYGISIKEFVSSEEMQNRILEEDAAKEELKAASREKEATIAQTTQEYTTQYNNGQLNDQLIKTESGLEYIIVKEGQGAKPSSGDMVDVHYYGVLASNGEMFDNSYQRGEFFTFPLDQGRVIRGWDEALLLMNKGSEGVFFIPYNLAYGEAGRPPRIPERAMLVFYIEYP